MLSLTDQLQSSETNYHKVYSENEAADSLNGVDSCRNLKSSTCPITEVVTRVMIKHRHAFCQLWILLSSLYGKLLLVLMVAFSLVEVMDNPITLLSLQGVYLMYLYVGSIAVIISIYIWVLVDSCSSLSSLDEESITASVVRDADLASFPLSKFGSLKKAHISRQQTTDTSFYLRIGALAFGLGTLVFNGLEMAMHSMMEGPCLNDVVFVHPVLHGLFTFLQMHFLFVNSQVVVEKFGLIARFGFMHLAATNLALWIRLVIWESGMEWIYFIYLAISGSYVNSVPTPLQLKGFPKSLTFFKHVRSTRSLTLANATGLRDTYNPVSDVHIAQVVALHDCLNTNTLGQLWTSSMPFLYPFIVQFSIIAAGVTYVMGQNVGKEKIYSKSLKVKKLHQHSVLNTRHTACTHERCRGTQIDCSGSSKGLFLGLLCVVVSIVIIIIFLVVKEDEHFSDETLYWITSGTVAAILTISLIATVPALVQIRKLSLTNRVSYDLDNLLCCISLAGVQLYTVFGILVGASSLYELSTDSSNQRQYTMLLVVSTLQLLQSTGQSVLITEGLHRNVTTKCQIIRMPAKQVITFLLCSNMSLWALDSFVTQSWLSQELQLKFMGVLAWGVVSRIALPLLMFYRFHSAVLLLEIWQSSYYNSQLDSSTSSSHCYNHMSPTR
ncbi:proton channel OtopLc-like isoform X2 [Rhodnius prolixus]|uniref:proton channel OtopLc-like isoform X2 n=1 Tax=Rhodnius prolixus TaxID=13249 RepID=UPI003D18A519